jgi:hypothetical protein
MTVKHITPDSYITVCTVNWYSYGLINNLFANLTEKADKPDQIKFLVIDNTNAHDKDIYRLREKYNIRILSNDTRHIKGSMAHACGLNLALRYLNSEYCLIVDPDTYIFKKKWDTFLIDMLEEEEVFVIGVSYPLWQLGKYHDFPNPVFCFFKTDEYMRLEPDWTPFGANKLVKCWDYFRRNVLRLGIIINRKAYEKYKLIRTTWSRLEKIIGICSKDTGWRIAKKARENNIKAEVFKATLSSEIVKGSETIIFRQLASEFELYCYENEPILTHKYSSCSLLWRTKRSRDSELWLELINSFLSSNKYEKSRDQCNNTNL